MHVPSPTHQPTTTARAFLQQSRPVVSKRDTQLALHQTHAVLPSYPSPHIAGLATYPAAAAAAAAPTIDRQATQLQHISLYQGIHNKAGAAATAVVFVPSWHPPPPTTTAPSWPGSWSVRRRDQPRPSPTISDRIALDHAFVSSTIVPCLPFFTQSPSWPSRCQRPKPRRCRHPTTAPPPGPLVPSNTPLHNSHLPTLDQSFCGLGPPLQLPCPSAPPVIRLLQPAPLLVLSLRGRPAPQPSCWAPRRFIPPPRFCGVTTMEADGR